ncbi:hypothetical protein [Rhizobium sp. BK176]|uniref:hypothetical protein n=1 Tax=Rhizobium sp. BK176 TaxID=2587071 RepID=UPI002167B2EF|nr:hypothetical protein [Rhizobium sp. BK176]MCS4089947.1 hypothetical protein [Rhizobium sp. BK176]
MRISEFEFMLSDHPAAVKLRAIADLKSRDVFQHEEELELLVLELGVERLKLDLVPVADGKKSILEAISEVESYLISDEVLNSLTGKTEEEVHQILTEATQDSADLLDHHEKKFISEIDKRKRLIELIDEAATILKIDIDTNLVPTSG